MALDFPTPTSIGQVYTGTNGVTYIWTGTLWLASGASAGGDFYATGTGGAVNTVADTTIIPTTVVSGNSTGSYSTSTGRYVPPAGRYSIFGWYSAGAGGTATAIYIYLYKNGTLLPNSYLAFNIGASLSAGPSISAVVDANGTDYFELRGKALAASTFGGFGFGAYPISGIKGPPGDPGMPGFRLLQRTVVSSAVPTVDIIGIASDINDLKFTFDALPQTNAVGFYLQFFDSTGTIITSGYSGGGILTTSASGLGSAPFNHPMSNTGAVLLNYNAASNLVNNTAGTGIRGSGNVVNIRDATRQKYVDWQCAYLTDTSAAYDSVVGAAQRTAAGSITGLRFFFSAGNIASGAISVWGSP